MRRSAAAVAALSAALLLGGCDGSQAVLNPRGESAALIADLWWVMFGLGAAVWVVVVVMAVYVLFVRGRAPHDEAAAGPIAHRTAGDAAKAKWVVGGVAASLVILIVVFGYSLFTGRSMQAMARAEPLTIEVVGRQWWWQVTYLDPEPSKRFVTANEIRIPAGRPVRVDLRSEDVIHSFWVPNLSGKMDLVPGRTNTVWLRSDEPGIYRGQCAEFCGLQHANMAFMVRVEEPEEYERWAAGQLRPATEPATPLEREGQRVFRSSGCAICHTVRGTGAAATLGPDLTHLATRLSLAAGILPNTRGHLGGWISNPQVIKPGNEMPRVELDSEELQALLSYLESLN